MPIVDGMTSTEMIREYEHKSPSLVGTLYARAKLNGRSPIIAVSASLVEAQKQSYIDAGFDAWILKPISFTRLSEIINGIVNPQARKENLYAPGEWERGGWFAMAKPIIETPEDDVTSSRSEGFPKSRSAPQLRQESEETVTAG